MFLSHRMVQRLVQVLGKTLQQLRIERGLTQSFVAEALGVATVTVRRWEMAIRRPSPDNLKAFAALFETTADELLLEAMRAVIDGEQRRDG